MLFKFTQIIWMSLILTTAYIAPTLAATTLGDMVNTTYDSFIPIQAFLSSIAYILGIYSIFTGLKMARMHTESPGDARPLHIGLRFAGGALLILTPFAANVLVTTISGGGVGSSAVNVADIVGGFGAPAGALDGEGLDVTLNRLVSNVWAPLMDNLLPLFCYAAGLVLMLVALKRLALASNDGPQAPGGLGTLTTFFSAAGLMSAGYLMGVMQGSLFGANEIYQNVTLAQGANTPQAIKAQNALWGIFVFLRIVGYISFIRGLFILRGAAEGANNASMMAASTHIIAGALLANGLRFAQVIQETIFNDPADWILQVS